MKPKISKVSSAVIPAVLSLLLLVLLMTAGCSAVRYGSVNKPGEGVPSGAPEHEVNLAVQGHHFVISVPGQVTAKDVLTAAGPEGFYWALPQAPGEKRLGYITGPAVIHYTAYTQQGPVDPETAPVIYRLPLKDICNTSARPGVLRLLNIELHGKWLFCFYDSEMKDAAQDSYVALGVLDNSNSHPESTVRFLYRGLNCGGGQLEWAAGKNFVVWQQGYPDVKKVGSLYVTTSLYDLKTGKQQALSLPSGDSEMTQVVLKDDILQYKDAKGNHTLTLPTPGSGRLLPGAHWLPAVAFGEVTSLDGRYLPGKHFQGTVYLPAVVDPAPFYQIQVKDDDAYYSVAFDANEHPVPLNATEKERRELGPDPSMAQTLGSIEGYIGTPPAVKNLALETLPTGKLFNIHLGKRIIAGHFVSSPSSQVSVWWKDGAWRYRLLNYNALWRSPSDPVLQKILKEVISELPPNGNLVPDSEQGEVSITLAPDHRGTNVWFRRGKEWVHLEGYGYDALRGVQTLVAVKR